MKKVYQLLGMIVVILAIADTRYASVSYAATQEYQVKVAFLMNFAKFTDWPASTFADDQAPFVLGILGADPFNGAIEVLNGQTVKNRPIKVQRFSRIDGVQRCHILYIGSSEGARLRDIVRTIGAAPVLTVSDGLEQFAQQGVVINFLLVDNKIRFEINVAVAKKAGLSLAAQLLQVGKVVDGEQ